MTPATHDHPVPRLYPLFEHMSREHGLTLLDSEMEEICRIADSISADKRRMDWLETQNCWIGLKEKSWNVEPTYAAGGNFVNSVREVCDRNISLNAEDHP